MIAEAEAVLSEWQGPPDVDAALDFYTGLLDVVQGRISKAQGTRELNQALSHVIAGLWAEVEPDRDRLLVEFELTGPSETTLPGGITPMFASRPALPPRRLDDGVIEPKPGLSPSSNRELSTTSVPPPVGRFIAAAAPCVHTLRIRMQAPLSPARAAWSDRARPESADERTA